MATGHFLSETVEGGRDVRMSLQVDPASKVLRLGDLPDHEILPKVFMVDNEGSVADHMFNLCG